MRFGEPVSGAVYRRGLILLGEDVTDICDHYLVRHHNRTVWWDIARLLAHEVSHGVAPRSSNALEEAVAETHGRRGAGRLLRLLDGAPGPPPARHWETAGMYPRQVRWLDQLASWLGLTRTAVAGALKDGRAHRGLPAQARQEMLLGHLVAERRLDAQLPRARVAALGFAVARSAGSVNVPGKPPVEPRSPLAALEEHRLEAGW